ncbi:MAG TPA: zinc ribbon domain-containing protein, partial [Clostridium sp.]
IQTNNNTNLNVIYNTKNQLKNLLRYYTTYSTQAINTNDISLIDPYVVSGSDLYKDQQSYIPSTYKSGIKINIISANITDYNISDDNKSGSITASLVYKIIAKDGTSSNKTFNYVYEFQYNDSTSNYQFVGFK